MILKSSVLLSAMSYEHYLDDLTLYLQGNNKHQLEYDENLLPHIIEATQIIDRIETELKQIELKPLSSNLDILLLCISEYWCGDAANVLPHVNTFTQRCDRIKMRVLFRDQNESLINKFLTNGGKSIPIIIAIDEITSEVIGSWGPRPQFIQDYVLESKSKQVPFSQLWQQVKLMYDQDFGKTIVADIEHLLLNHLH